MPDLVTKRCTKCGEAKPLDDFPQRKNAADGRRNQCHACRYAREGRKYYEANRETILARQRRYRQANPDVVSQRNRRWREVNPGIARALRRRWYETNRAAVFNHYGQVCTCCGTDDNLSIDHIHGDGQEHRQMLFGNGHAGGGQFYEWLVSQDFPPGLQVLCGPCNASKGRGERCRLNHSEGT